MKISLIATLITLLTTLNSPKTIYNHFVTEENEVALTFDDGPSPYTLKILEILKENSVKATFFMLGESIEKDKSLVNKIAKEGHTIGLHSYTHPNFHKLNCNQIKDEITSNQELIGSSLGYKPKIIRPPYGIISNNFLSVATELNLTIYTWTTDTFDWKKENSSTTIINNAMKAKKGSIILMHDKSANISRSIKALPLIIQRLKAKGFKFITLKEMK